MKITRTAYNADYNFLECLHCHNLTELYRNTGTDPQKLLEVREGYERRHSTDSACASYALESAIHDLEREPALDARALAMHVLGTKSFA